MSEDEKAWTIGASESAAALGLSPYRSPFAWWAEKTGKIDRTESTEATRVGTALEPALSSEFERAHNVVLAPTARLVHPDAPWMHATPDRFLRRDMCSSAFIDRWEIEAKEIIPVEFKTGSIVRLPSRATEEEWGPDGSDIIPQGYAVQVQQQIDVTNAYVKEKSGWFARRAFVFALLGNRGFALFAVDGLPDVQSWICDELETIVTVNLALDIPLKPETKDDWDVFAEVATRKSTGKARRVVVDDEADLVREYFEIHRRIKNDEERRSELRARLIAAIGNGYALTVNNPSTIITALLTEGSEKERDKPRRIVDDITAILPSFDAPTRETIERIIAKHTTTVHGGRQLRVTEKVRKP